MKIQIVCSLLGLLCGQPVTNADILVDCPNGTRGWGNMSSCGSGGSCIVEKLIEVSPGKCKWVEDEAATKKDREWRAQIEKERQDLLWAARTRPLTDAEMEELRNRGESILTPENVPFFEETINKEYNDLLLHQFEIRELAAHAIKAH